MKSINPQNEKDVIEFIQANIKNSLFIYGNLKEKNKILRFKAHNNKIVGLYLIINKKYITYLFEDNIEEQFYKEIVDDAQGFEHSQGTKVEKNPILLNMYYEVGDEAEIALLNLSSKNKYSKNLNVELLDLVNSNEVQEYMDCLDKIQEFNVNKEDFLTSAKNNKIYVYKQNGNIIGGATLCSISDKTAVITTVFTNKQYRNIGIGTKLLEHLLLDNSDKNRMIFIFFNNPKAKSIYLKLGFEVKDKMYMFNKKIKEEIK